MALPPQSSIEFHQCFLEDEATGCIRITSKGHEHYAARFAHCGIDIRTIRTRAQFREACQRSQWVLWDEVRTMVAGHPELEALLRPLWQGPPA